MIPSMCLWSEASTEPKSTGFKSFRAGEHMGTEERGELGEAVDSPRPIPHTLPCASSIRLAVPELDPFILNQRSGELGFSEFCELLQNISQTQEEHRWDFQSTAGWSEAQVTAWTGGWHRGRISSLPVGSDAVSG